jgi:hypothetical protein
MAVTKTTPKSVSEKLVKGVKAKVAKNDLFVEVASEVEHLTKAKAFSMVSTLLEDVESNHFRLGGVLSRIQEQSTEDDAWLSGQTSFRDLVQETFGLHYRKAMYLIDIYRNLVEKQIPWESVKGLGWTKLKELAKVLTPKNVDGWAKRAEKMTVLQIIESVKKAMAKGGSDAKMGDPSTVSTMTFKVHEDQKDVIRKALDKIKKATKTEFDTVALHNMSAAYLGNAITVEVVEAEAKEAKEPTKKDKLASLTTLMTELGHKEVLGVFEKVFPKIDLEVTENE